MPKADIQVLRDVSKGIIQGVDESIVAKNSVYLAVNFDFDNFIGRAKLRAGSALLGAQVVNNVDCLGLHQHNTASGTKVPLAVFDDAESPTNSDIYKYTSSTWSKAKEDQTAGLKTHFATFLDTTVAVNGTDTPTSTIDGAAWVVTGGNLDVGNMPVGKYVMEFKDRVYTAGVSGNLDRLYYSGLPSSGTVSWTTGNGYIDIEPEEGAGAITGLAKVPGYVLIFKERSLKRWDSSSTYPESLIDVGCPSQEGVVMARQSVFYFNKRGVFETIGGYPRKISRPIQDIIDAIPSSYYASVSGWADKDNIYFSIGDVTVDGYLISNAVIKYNIDSQIWALRSYPNEFLAWYTYVDSNGDEIVIAGDDDGQVWQLNTGTQDGSTSIKWMLQYHTQEFGHRGRIKDVTNTGVFTENIRTGVVHYRIDNTGDFKSMGNITKNIMKITHDLRGHYFEFRLEGSDADAEIVGIEFPDININLNYD